MQLPASISKFLKKIVTVGFCLCQVFWSISHFLIKLNKVDYLVLVKTVDSESTRKVQLRTTLI